MREDFRELISGSKPSSLESRNPNLIELNLTNSERRELRRLLDIEEKKRIKLHSSLLQPALESFDELVNLKLEELRLLEEEAALEARLFSARLEFYEADNYN